MEPRSHSVKRQYSPQLEWLPTHDGCNAAERPDEEYFVVSFAGHLKSATATAVFEDIRRGAAKGRGIGLIKEVLSRFGKVQGPQGELLFSYDNKRVSRFIRKIVRGQRRDVAADSPATDSRGRALRIPGVSDRHGCSLDRIAAAPVRIRDTTDGYRLVDLFAAWSFRKDRRLSTITLRVDNAADTLYRSHLSFIKAYAPERGRDVKLTHSIGF